MPRNFANGAQPDRLMGKAENPVKFAERDIRAPFALQRRRIVIGNSSKCVPRRRFDGALCCFLRSPRINARRRQPKRGVISRAIGASHAG